MVPGHSQLQFMGCGGKMDYHWCSVCKKAVRPIEMQELDEVFLCCPNCFIDDLGLDTIPDLGEVVLDDEEEELQPGEVQIILDPEVEVTLEKPWDESIDTSSDDDSEDTPPVIQENIPEYEMTWR